MYLGWHSDSLRQNYYVNSARPRCLTSDSRYNILKIPYSYTGGIWNGHNNINMSAWFLDYQISFEYLIVVALDRRRSRVFYCRGFPYSFRWDIEGSLMCQRQDPYMALQFYVPFEGHYTLRRGVRYDSTSQSIVPPAGLEPGTSWLLAVCLNYFATNSPRNMSRSIILTGHDLSDHFYVKFLT